MIRVEKMDIFNTCDECGYKGKVNFIGCDFSAIVLCDDCMKELKDKIIIELDNIKQ